MGDSSAKAELIPHVISQDILAKSKVVVAIQLPLFEEPAAYQLVGEVTAHQGFDG